MKIRALIIDDEPLARDVIRIMLDNQPDIEIIGECGNGNEAVQIIREHSPDLVFLDVQMPDLDGFGVVKQVGIEQMPEVIFVTAYDQYAIRAFEVHALDYLLKPFDQDRFDQALHRALKQIRQEKSTDVSQRLLDLLESTTAAKHSGGAKFNAKDKYLKRMVIKESGRVFFIKTEEIDWIEAAGDYVTLHIGPNTHMVHASMGGLEAKLAPDRFLRIHRSTIVNTDRIRELQPHANGEYFVYLDNGSKLKLSRNYRENLRSFFGDAL